MIKVTAYQYQQCLMSLPNPATIDLRQTHYSDFVVPVVPIITARTVAKESNMPSPPIVMRPDTIRFEIVHDRVLPYWQPYDEVLIIKEPN